MMPRPDASGDRRCSAAEVLKYLPPDLLAVLASLHGVPRSLANATIQLLPFGSRTALECMDPSLADPGPATSSDGHRSLILTDFAFDVIAEAHAAAEANPKAVSDWTARADEVARMVATPRSK